jgi:geranylgeranyl diphosphate synthase type II
MDDAPLRRGHQTVHEKWDVNSGILSDAMLILAYQYFEQYEAPIFMQFGEVVQQNSTEVCEGQQWMLI